ncbi:MAG: type II toxin-antitoxin system RelE/ParE family toxin [Chloroflexi bacterium]|nr:type II toxin-antitoxin system RelE/ParE family toxin [Chloroflexota bacterium]
MSQLLVADHAANQLTQLSERDKSRVARAIDKLALDPISQSHLLRNTEYGTGLRVMQAGGHRIIYSISEETNTVTVITVTTNHAKPTP